MAAGSWVRDRSIATKVLAAVAVGVASLGVVGTYGVLELGSVSSDASTLYDHGVRSYETLADLRDMEGDTRFLLRDYVRAASEQDRAALREEMTATDEQLDADVATYQRIGGDSLGDRADLMQEFEKRLAALRELRDQEFLPAVDRGDIAAATTLLDTDLLDADEFMGEPMDELLAQEDDADRAMQEVAVDGFHSGRALLLGFLLGGALLATGLGWLVARGISRPVRAVMRVLDRLGRGDLTGHVDVRSSDEVGRMAVSLNTATDTLRDTVERLAESAGAVARYSDEVSSVSAEVEAAAADVDARADAMAGTARGIGVDIDHVTTGATEMGSSIREIARSASDAADVAGEAVEAADRTNSTVARLGASSVEIGNVVKLITSIAEQTNLLALNATIEAARAGEAGKGFAVVANEVKELAQETARATDVIAHQVDTIQADSQGAAAAIAEVGAVIGRVNDHAATIAAAVEEQTATTNEMVRSVEEVAGGASLIAAGIGTVGEAGAATMAASARGQRAAEQLAGTSRELSALVDRFTLA